MPKVISDLTKNGKIYINLAPCFSWNHCFEYKFAVDVLSFDMLPAWIIHQIVYFYSGRFLRPRDLLYAQTSWWVQNFIFPNSKQIFSNSLIILKFEEMEYLIHYVWNVSSLILCKLLILFSTMKLKLGPNFFSIHP